MTQGTDTALAHWIRQEGLVDPLILQGCLAEVRQRRWSDPDVSLAMLLIDRRLVDARRVQDGLSSLGGPMGALAPAERELGDLPERIGPYRVMRELARGGMGAVLEVVHVESGVRYALKLILGGILGRGDEEGLERFQREAELTARLDHPHVVRIHAAELEGPRPYLVADLLPGGTLQARIEARTRLEAPEAVSIALKLARALQHAHGRGVLHRDLKPHNVLFDDRGEPRIVDWGLARSLREASVRLTATGAILGTPGYMPPEQAQGQMEIGPGADVYALGAILFAMLTGRPPFMGPRALLVLDHVMHTPPPPIASLAELPASCAEVLELVVGRALAKAPHERPTLEELIEVLNRVDRSETQTLRVEPRAPTRSWLKLTLGSLVAGAVLLGAGLALRPAPERRDALERALVSLDAHVLAACAGEPAAEDGLERAQELEERVAALDASYEPGELRALRERARQHVRFARWRAQEEVQVGGGGGALGALVDALILRERKDAAGALRAARRAWRTERGSLAAWTLLLELTRSDEEGLLRLAAEFGSEDPSAARSLAWDLLEPFALARLQAFPDPSHPSLERDVVEQAALGVQALRRLGAPAERLARLVRAATERNALGWVALLGSLPPERIPRAFQVLGQLGGRPVELGPRLRGELREWVERQARVSQELSRELSRRTLLGRDDQARRAQARAALHRALLCDQALVYEQRALAPAWKTPAALVENASTQLLVEERGSASLSAPAALLVMRCGSKLLFTKVTAHLTHAEAQGFVTRLPRSRAAAFLMAQLDVRERGRNLEHRELEDLDRIYAAVSRAVEPNPRMLDDLHETYLGSAELMLAEICNRKLYQRALDEPGAQEDARRLLGWARSAAQRTLPDIWESRTHCLDLESSALTRLGREREALALWEGLQAQIERGLSADDPGRDELLARTWIERGRIFRHLKQPAPGQRAYEEALRLLQARSELRGRRPEARLGLSMCLYYGKNREGAWKVLRLDEHPAAAGASVEHAKWSVRVARELFGDERAREVLEQACDAWKETELLGGRPGIDPRNRARLRSWGEQEGL